MTLCIINLIDYLRVRDSGVIA